MCSPRRAPSRHRKERLGDAELVHVSRMCLVAGGAAAHRPERRPGRSEGAHPLETWPSRASRLRQATQWRFWRWSNARSGVGGQWDTPVRLPPLNADVFAQLQTITAAKHQSAVKSVLDDVLKLHGPNFDLSLEQYLTQLEAMISTIEASSSSTVTFSVARLQIMRTHLLNALSAILEGSER